MNKIKVKKSELLEILNKNRAIHIQMYKDAVDGFRIDTRAKLEEELKVENRSKSLSISMSFPQSYEKSYDTAIKMMEMSVEDIVEIEQYEFERFVEDNWEWKREFTSSNATYSKTGFRG